MYVTIDIGGTSMRLAASLDLKKIERTMKIPTPKEWPAALRAVSDAARTIAGGAPISVAMGVPGVVNPKTGMLKAAPNLPGWADRPVGEELSKALAGTPVWLENDTAIGGLGEAAFGAGQGKRIVAYMALGTGIGGCRIEDGKPSRHVSGFEPGHMIVERLGKAWPPCGQRGCLEAYCSGSAFWQEHAMRAEDCKDKKIWKAYAKRLAQGVVNVITLWSPDVVVIGGGFGINAAPMLPFLREEVAAMLKIFETPPIEPAALGDDSGLYGGMRLIDAGE